MQSTASLATLVSLYCFVTWRCNLRCQHCWASAADAASCGPTGGEFTESEFTRMLVRAREVGLQAVKLSGGEPLLRMDLVRAAVEFCCESGTQLAIETNGTLIDRSTAMMLATVRPRVGIGISLDSHREEFHDEFRGSRGAYKRTIEGIATLSAFGVVPHIVMSVTKDNVDHIPGMAKLAKQLGLGRLKINPVTPIGRGQSLGRRLLSVEDVIELNDMLRACRREMDVEVTMGVPMVINDLANIRSMRHINCPFTNMLAICPNGDVTLCACYGDSRGQVYGNIRTDDIGEIWTSNPKLREIRDSIPSKLEGICARCFFKGVCRGSCRAEALRVFGSFLKPYPICEYLDRLDRFPRKYVIDQ